MKKLNEALIVLDADIETAEDCIRLAGEMFEKKRICKRWICGCGL